MSNIYDDSMIALLARLQTKCGAAFKSYNRGILLYDDMIQRLTNPEAGGPAMVFPQLWLYEGVGLGGGTVEFVPVRGAGAKRTMSRTIVMYDRKPNGNTPAGADGTATGMIQLNPLLQLVVDAFAPDTPSLNTLTLGNLVSHCWIEGEVYSIPGDIDPSGLAMQTVPVKILIP